MSGYGMMIPGSKARSNLVSERPTEHGGKEVEHNMIKEAAEFADRAHQGVFRKGTEIPYITHPMETAAIVTAFTDEPEMIAAALLHDVIEDAGVTREELEEKFGPRVAFLVDGESEDKSKSWVERKGATVERLKTATRDEKILALADKLSNIRSTARDYLVLGDEVWQRFNQKDKDRRLPEKQDRIQVLRKTQAEPYSRLDRIHFRSTTVYISEIRAGAIRQQITRHCQPHQSHGSHL